MMQSKRNKCTKDAHIRLCGNGRYVTCKQTNYFSTSTVELGYNDLN
jgi:hypothetical protein